MRPRRTRALVVLVATLVPCVAACQLVLGLEKPHATTASDAASDRAEPPPLDAAGDDASDASFSCVAHTDGWFCTTFDDESDITGTWETCLARGGITVEVSAAEHLSPPGSFHARMGADAGDPDADIAKCGPSAFISRARANSILQHIELAMFVAAAPKASEVTIAAIAFSPVNKPIPMSAPALVLEATTRKLSFGDLIQDAAARRFVGTVAEKQWYHVAIDFLDATTVRVSVRELGVSATIEAGVMPNVVLGVGVQATSADDVEVYIDDLFAK
jgi:hypothetical protein